MFAIAGTSTSTYDINIRRLLDIPHQHTYSSKKKNAQTGPRLYSLGITKSLYLQYSLLHLSTFFVFVLHFVVHLIRGSSEVQPMSPHQNVTSFLFVLAHLSMSFGLLSLSLQTLVCLETVQWAALTI